MIVFSSFGHARFVFACVVQPVISRPGCPGGLLREVSLAVVFPSFGHSRFVFAAVVCPVISRPECPGGLLREVRLAIVVLSFGHSRFCPYARTGNSSLHSGGNLSILWARPVLSCLYSLFLSLRAIPLPWRGNPFPHS